MQKKCPIPTSRKPIDAHMHHTGEDQILHAPVSGLDVFVFAVCFLSCQIVHSQHPLEVILCSDPKRHVDNQSHLKTRANFTFEATCAPRRGHRGILVSNFGFPPPPAESRMFAGNLGVGHFSSFTEPTVDYRYASVAHAQCERWSILIVSPGHIGR